MLTQNDICALARMLNSFPVAVAAYLENTNDKEVAVALGHLAESADTEFPTNLIMAINAKSISAFTDMGSVEVLEVGINQFKENEYGKESEEGKEGEEIRQNQARGGSPEEGRPE